MNTKITPFDCAFLANPLAEAWLSSYDEAMSAGATELTAAQYADNETAMNLTVRTLTQSTTESPHQ